MSDGLPALLGLLGIARRAGRLAFGLDVTIERTRKGETFLLLSAVDASPRVHRELARAAEAAGIPALPLPCDRDTLGRAIGRSATACVAVCDEKLAAKAAALCAEPST